MQTGDTSSSPREALSLLIPIGASYYVRSKVLSPQHYQELMDRGWRRSGSLLYLPDASRSCCPHYTIRLPASEFKPSRDQRQALNRWNRFVLGDAYFAEAKIKFPQSKEEKKQQNNTFDLISAVHESELSNLKPGLKPAHRFEITLEPDEFSQEKFALFAHYQRHVHHEGDSDISEVGFKRFLCSSTISRFSNSRAQRFGSFHQCYRLDGRLIAMAVLDLLPHAVSGVYFIYHNDYEKWSFGKLSAMREAALALEEGYQYYYMGYYIHKCKKMKYKADFRPQYVLDYHNLQWDVLDDHMRDVMDRCKYASMSRERARTSASTCTSDNAVITMNDADVKDNERKQEQEDEEILHPLPLQAMSSDLSLLSLRVPGVMTLDQLLSQVDLDRMMIYLGRDGMHEAQDISTWSTGSDLDPSSLRGIFAEFAAAVGPVVAQEAIVSLGG